MQLTVILCLLATAGECDEDPFTSDEGKMNVQTVTSMIRKFITHLIFGVPRGGGSIPLYKPYSYVPPQRVGFLRCFDLKTGNDFAHFGLKSWFSRELQDCMNVFVVPIPNE